jgi:brefeldin A-resistance guanine nucleotide exchange factor 1
MADGGYLVPPSQDPSKETTWAETKKRLDRFLPDLFKELFPDTPKDIPAPSSPAAGSPSITAPQETPSDEKKEVPTEGAEATPEVPPTRNDEKKD